MLLLFQTITRSIYQIYLIQKPSKRRKKKKKPRNANKEKLNWHRQFFPIGAGIGLFSAIASDGFLSSVTSGISLSNVSLPLFQTIIFSCILHCFLASLLTLFACFAILYIKKRLFNKMFIT